MRPSCVAYDIWPCGSFSIYSVQDGFQRTQQICMSLDVAATGAAGGATPASKDKAYILPMNADVKCMLLLAMLMLALHHLA